MSKIVLIIDDDPIIRLVTAEALTHSGCKVLQAPDGASGITAAAQGRPDLILLDYSMPDMDGVAVLSKIRASLEISHAPVMMLTSDSERGTVLKTARLGISGYMVKPIKVETMVQKISQFLKLQPEGAEPAAEKAQNPIQVLVLDESPATAEQIRNAFAADSNWKVLSSDEPDQLNSCIQYGVHVVLVSLSLPNDKAHILCAGLRKHPKTAKVPIIALSSEAGPIQQASAQRAGFSGLLSKPVDVDKLKSVIKSSLKL